MITLLTRHLYADGSQALISILWNLHGFEHKDGEKGLEILEVGAKEEMLTKDAVKELLDKEAETRAE